MRSVGKFESSFLSKEMFLISVFVAIMVSGCNRSSANYETIPDTPMVDTGEIGNEAWRMEEIYWEYVQNMDTVSYKKLWHEDFIGYPSFGDGVSTKKGIAAWIPDLHKDPNRIFSYELYRRATNVIEDVVIVFYDADEIFSDPENNIVEKKTYKFTHTWKMVNGNWVILGGMAALKQQDSLDL